MPAPIVSILSGFADARSRLTEEWTEREIHPFEDRPVGSGWVRVGTDAGYGIWERRRRLTPGAQACSDVRAWQRGRAGA